MKHLLKFTCTTCLLIASFAISNGQSIKDLDFLIGTWEVTETIYPGTDRAYQEKGTRTCEYYLADAFVKCEAKTTVSSSGKVREYVYFINYDEKQGFFAATSLANDFPITGIHQWRLNDEKNKIRYISPKNVIGDRFVRGTLTLETPDKIVWEGWWSKFDSDKEWEQIFEDVAIRKK